MVDISTVAATMPAAGAPTPLAAIQAAVTAITGDLQNLQRTVQLNAVPVAPPSNNQITLQTGAGTITLTLPGLSVPGDAAQQALLGRLLTQLDSLAQNQRPLTLVLQPATIPGAPPAQATLILPLPGTASPTGPVAPPALPDPTAASIAPPIVTPGASFPALVLPSLNPMTGGEVLPPPPQSSAMASNPPAPAMPASGASPGPSPAPATAASLPTPPSAPSGVPAGQTASPPAPAPGGTTSTAAAAPFGVALPSPPSAAPSAPSAPLPLIPGQQVMLRVSAVLPSGQAASPPPLAPGMIATQVQPGALPGRMLLKSGDVVFLARAAQPLPAGTTVILTARPIVDAAAAPVTLPPADTSSFASMAPLLAALAQGDPSAQQQFLARLPQPTEALPHALALLFTAFRSGDAPQWLGGDVTQALQHAGKAELIAALSHDLAQSGQSVQDDMAGTWQSYPLPFYMHGVAQPVTLHVRPYSPDERDASTGPAARNPGTRFLIEMKLTRLGDMQIDGFVRPKNLDMVLRSAQHLPPGLHDELRAAYIRSIEAVGYRGGLTFQAGRGNWLTIRTQPSRSALI